MDHMSTRQHARLAREWVVGIGLPAQDYGTHSLRRTKASIIYKATSTSAPFRSFSAMPRSTARCATWALTWRTLWNWPNAPRSERTHDATFVAYASVSKPAIHSSGSKSRPNLATPDY